MLPRLVVGAVVVLVALCTPADALGQSVVRSISQSSDDAEQYTSSGSMYLDSSDLELLTESDCCGIPAQMVGLRFQNITVPIGATITGAYIQFHVDETRPSTAVTVTISGEDTDDASTFTTSTNNISGRTSTTATVDWAIPHWAAVNDEGSAQLTPDLSTIVQEIVNRAGWSSGNDIAILFKTFTGSGTRVAESYDGESASAAEITITYTVDTTPPGTPSINSPTSPTSDPTPEFTGTATEDGGTITLTSSLDGVLSPTAVPSGGTWSLTPGTGLSNGTHTITAVHRDAAGNASSTSSGVQIEVAVTASVDDFRSAGSGDWSDDANWERWNGSAWTAAPNDPTSSDGEITILSGHTITVDSDRTVDQLIVEAGATLNTSGGKLTIDDGTGIDFRMYGSMTAAKEFIMKSSSTSVFYSTADVELQEKTHDCKDSATCTFQSGAQLTVTSGTFRVQGSATLTVNSGAQITNSAGGTLEFKSSSVQDIYGTVVNSGSLAADNNPTTTIRSGGVWEHAAGATAFPALTPTTWESNSTLLITGVTSSLPSNFTDSYGNITWNSTGQTAALNWNASPAAIAGDLTVQSTGSGSLRWGSSSNLTLGGDYIQSGGSFIFTSSTGTMTAGDVNVTGGTFTVSTGSSLITLNVTGGLTVNGGTLTETSSTSASIKLNGSSQQTITAPSGMTGDIDLYLLNSAGAVLASDLTVPRHVILTTGTLDLNDQDLSLGGGLTISSDVANPAAITFTGSTTRTISYAPGTLNLPTLIVEKPSSLLALATDITISNTVTVRSGTLNVNGYTLTLEHGATLYNGGTVSGNITMKRTYSQTSDGWRMIAPPVSGVYYSSLNTSFHTQGAPWADFTDGTATLQAADFAAQWWTPIDGADAEFTEGAGYIFYMYNQEKWDTILPATWTVTGPVRAAQKRTLSWNTVDTDSYNFVANTTTSNLDWDAVVAASSNVAATYVTWDPSLTDGGGLTGYKYYNSTTGLGDASRYIAPFTAYMVRPSSSSNYLFALGSEAANAGAADYFGKTTRQKAAHLRLSVEGLGMAETETYLSFTDTAARGRDETDVPRAAPLSADYVTLVSLDEAGKLAFDGRPLADSLFQYDLAVMASRPGLYTLSWSELDRVPPNWELRLQDLSDFRTFDLRRDDAMQVYVSEAETVRPERFNGTSPKPRFRLTIAASGELMPAEELPVGALTLAPNYPNPFSESTTIRFSLPERGPVAIEFFDLLGRRVGQAIQGDFETGWHEVRWTGSGLPSGPYLYRVRTGHATATGTMILAR